MNDSSHCAIALAPMDRQDIPTVRRLFTEYAASLPIDIEYQGLRAELAGLPGAYATPRGIVLLAQADGLPAGCVALRPIGEGVGEIKRLYVRPSHRGAGLGARLIAAVLEHAKTQAYAEVKLDTLASMTVARALYERFGFRPTAPYNRGYHPETCFYALKLCA